MCKYLFYPTSTPLLEPDIPNTKTLLFTHISPIPLLPNVTDTEKSFVIVTLDNFNLGSQNRLVKASKIIFDIVCHVDLWLISGGKLRPFRIMNSIDSTFNNQRLFGIKKLRFDSARRISINEKFHGYRVEYSVVDVN